MTLRFDDDGRAALDALQAATGEKSTHKAIWCAIEQYPRTVQSCRDAERAMADMQRRLLEIETAVSAWKEAETALSGFAHGLKSTTSDVASLAEPPA